MTMRQTLSAAVIGLAALTGLTAHAATVYSNLSGTGTYTGFSAISIRGANVPPNSLRAAVSFTPAQNYTLDSIELGVSSDTNFTDNLTVTLAASDSGLPGAGIETFGVLSGFPEFNTSDSFLATATSAANPLLQAGVEYFVILEAADPDSKIKWHNNNQGATGRFLQSGGGAFWTTAPGSPEFVFRVNGTAVIVPTPTAVAAGAALLGLLGLTRVRRRPSA